MEILSNGFKIKSCPKVDKTPIKAYKDGCILSSNIFIYLLHNSYTEKYTAWAGIQPAIYKLIPL